MINRAFLCCVLLVSLVFGSEELRTRARLNTTFESVPVPSSSDPRIVGGFEIPITDAPYQVSVQFQSKHICGGSIISPSWVVTAAQCTRGARAPQLQVRVGSDRHAAGGTVIPVRFFTLFPFFNNATLEYDCALLLLQRDIVMGGNTGVIPLLKVGEVLPPNVAGFSRISGWGSTQDGKEYSAILRAANVPIVKQIDCRSAYDSYGTVTNTMICVGNRIGGKGSCQGDSGGPLVWNGKLIGIASWSVGCAQPGLPSVYTRADSNVRLWIYYVIGF